MHLKRKQEFMYLKTQDTMKNNVVIYAAVLISLIVVILFCINNFIRLDKKMYYYGLNSLDMYEPINAWITPINGFKRYNSFGNPYHNCVELWEDDFAIVAKGIVYNKYAGVVIDSLVSYGFNENYIVAECITDTKKMYFVILDNSKVATLINKDTCAKDSPLHNFQLKVWFDSVNDPPQQMITKHRFYKIICIIFLSVTLIFAIIMIPITKHS